MKKPSVSSLKEVMKTKKKTETELLNAEIIDIKVTGYISFLSYI